MKLASFLLVALLAGGYAQAQTSAPAGGGASPEQIARACRAEAKALCPGKTGQDAVNCLKSNSDKLSGKCKEHVSK